MNKPDHGEVYERQSNGERHSTPNPSELRLTRSDRSAEASRRLMQDALRIASIQQAVLLILAYLILDGGTLCNLFAISFTAYWTFALILLTRRPKHPTRVDVANGHWYCLLPTIVMMVVRVVGFHLLW